MLRNKIGINKMITGDGLVLFHAFHAIQCPCHSRVGHPIDSGMGLSITIDKLRVFINKTLSTQSLINQLLIKRVGLSIVIDNGKIGQGMRSCKCTNHNLYAGGCQ